MTVTDAPSPGAATEAQRLLVLACGALVKELQAVVAANRLDSVTIECLPAELHNRPAAIAPELEKRLVDRLHRYDRVLIGYADCGTGGAIDRLCRQHGLERLAGDHCYEFFARSPVFARLHDDEPGTFYLTDFLARHFDTMVIRTLGLDRHPQLLDLYFGNYTRLVYLAQLDDPDLTERAEAAADRLGLRFERVACGYGELTEAVVRFAGRRPSPSDTDHSKGSRP